MTTFDPIPEEEHPRRYLSSTYLQKKWKEWRSYYANDDCAEADARNLVAPRGSFEEQYIRASVKFEVGYLLVSGLVVVIYFVSHQGRAWPIEGVNLWPASAVSLALRGAILLVRPFVCKSYTSALQAFCFVIEGLLIASCYPRLAHHFWFTATSPEAPDTTDWVFDWNVAGFTDEQAANYALYWSRTWESWKTQYGEWELDYREFDSMLGEEFTMMQYQLNILIWYHMVFILTFRRALMVVPVIVLVYLLAAFHAMIEVDDHTREPTGCLEAGLLFWSAAVAVACKAKLEKAQRMEFQMAELKHKEFVKERVLRYEAEFQKEKVGTSDSVIWKKNSGPPSVTHTQSLTTSAGESSSSGCFSQAAASIRSAPAALHCGTVMSQTKRSGECLPPDAVVWVEGQALPRPVCSVVRGDRVLCYDSLSLAPKFVEVLASNEIRGTAAWVTVSLADGSNLTLTADHPTQPRRAMELPGAPHVAAADLKAGSDSLMVLKMQPVPVKSVVPMTCKDQSGPGNGRRIALTFQQPERHEVFVAPGGNTYGSELSTIAVGSADIAALPSQHADMGLAPGSKAFGLTVKRTFIDLEEEDDRVPYTRSSSCPPRVKKEIEKEQPQANKGAARRSGTKPGVTWALDPVVEARESGPPRLKRVASDSDVTSQSSRQSSTPTDVDVLVAVTGGAAAATVGEMLQIRRAGFASRGSCDHANGNCTVCFFENRHQHGEGPPCFKGSLCERCHEPHEPISRKKRVPGPTRTARRLLAKAALTDDPANSAKFE